MRDPPQPRSSQLSLNDDEARTGPTGAFTLRVNLRYAATNFSPSTGLAMAAMGDG
jgi:hypothetical protein